MYAASACRGIARLGGRAFPLQMCEKGLIRRCSALVRFDAHEWGRRGAGEAPVVPAASAKRRGGAVRRWTSDQARRPAELKHINKRRKSN